jgi:hypothetical protein
VPMNLMIFIFLKKKKLLKKWYDCNFILTDTAN